MSMQFVPVTISRLIIEQISRLTGGDPATGEAPQVVVDTIQRLVQETQMQAVDIPDEQEVSSLSEENWQDEGHTNCLDFACTLLDELQSQGIDISQFEIVILESDIEGQPGHVGLMDANGVFYDADGPHEDFEAWKDANEMHEVTNAEARPAGDDFLEIMSLPEGAERDARLEEAGLGEIKDLDVAIWPLLLLGAAVLILAGCSPSDVDLPTVDEAREILRNAPQRATFDDMTQQERLALYVVLREFVDPNVLTVHEDWHADPTNQSGGVTGPGSGDRFLTFHRGLVRDAERFVGGGFTMPMWNEGAPLPPEFFDTVDDPEIAAELQATLGITPSARNDTPDAFSRPGWLTTGGGPEFVVPSLGAPNDDLAGNTYGTLNDITTLDELGRLIGMYYHGVGHQSIGGTMMTFGSPADPAFFGWHENIDRVIDDWLATPSGQAWTAANPGHPINDPDNSMFTAP